MPIIVKAFKDRFTARVTALDLWRVISAYGVPKVEVAINE